MRRESWCPKEPQSRTSVSALPECVTDSQAFEILREIIDNLNTDLNDMEQWGEDVYSCACAEMESREKDYEEKMEELKSEKSELEDEVAELRREVRSLEETVSDLQDTIDNFPAET